METETTDSEEDLVEKLVYATASRNVREVEHLMQGGIDPSTPTKRNGCSPLHTAAVLESPSGPEIVSRMLYYGANPDVKTPTGLSALHIAAMWGRYETINVLLDNGADVADKDEDDMSALDYAEEAEKYKEQCIDALTRYRVNDKRTNRCFMTKSRPSLNKIMGGHVEFSTFLSERSSRSYDDSIEDQQLLSTKHDKINQYSSQEDLDDIMTDVSELSIHPEHTRVTSGDVQKKSCGNMQHYFFGDVPVFEREVITSPNMTFTDETLFQSCHENMSNVVQSTLLEDLHLSDDLSSSVLKESNSSANVDNRTASTIEEYSGDVSQHNPDGSSSSTGRSMDETFWSVRTAPSSAADESDENKENKTGFHQRQARTPKKDEKQTLPPLKRRGKKSKLFVPLSPLYIASQRTRAENMEIKPNESQKEPHQVDENREKLTSPSSNGTGNHDKLDHIPAAGSVGSPSSNDEAGTIDLLAEETVNYSNNKSVSELIEYYEDNYIVQEFDPKEETLSESPTKGPPKSPSRFVVLNCRDHDLPVHQRRSIDELTTITISYDWKDISQLKATEESEETAVIVSTSIQALTNGELRERLISHGETPGPISESTKKVYQRYLARLEANGGKMSDKNKESSDQKLKDYTYEMRQALLGVTTISRQRGEELETEMAFVFNKPEKHTWREGTQKTSFNYILLDPRVTNNLPDRCECMSVLEEFNVFVAAIFYIGKGKKSRPYEHFHEAVKFERNEGNKTKTASNKISMILDIWNSGYGVTTVHAFHSVIPVEAYTREACMIEAMNLSRLTNAKRGDFYGPASSWAAKKKRQLGIYLLMKAMKMYLIEGEKQIKQRDILK